MLKMVVPKIEMDGIARRSLFAPKLAGGEANGVYVLALGVTVGIGIREIVDAVIDSNRAYFASRVTRQASMACRMQIAGAHALPDFESRVNRRFVTGFDVTVERD